MADELCFCGLNEKFENCCGKIISGEKKAATPEELMRARYSAHASQSLQFLVDSVHPDHRKGVSVTELEEWSPLVQWTGLEIHSATLGETEDEGFVSFTAKFSVNNMEEEMRENSIFTKYNGEWVYVDGEVEGEEPFVREEKKVGRNDPCPCGSGKKFKKCCI